MKVKITILLGLISVNFSSNTVPKENENIEGYYWREYRGFIPEDAFPGGRDRDNKTTYIGQVLQDRLLIPAEIHVSEKRAYYEWAFREYVATENIKILCTGQPERLRWLRTTKDDFKLLNRNFVLGGYEPNNEMYIGRKAIIGSVVVGKVQVLLPGREAVFHFPLDKSGHFDWNFDVLVYANAPRYITISFYL